MIIIGIQLSLGIMQPSFIYMNFFNKYKDLFGVPDGTPLPKSKLSVNNNLFIDKPFVPTYQETLSINSKLRDLRKDYNQLQHQIQSINMVMKSPKRVPSRRAKDYNSQQNKQKDKISISYESPLLHNGKTRRLGNMSTEGRKAPNIQNQLFTKQGENQLDEQKNPFVKKMVPWMKDEQVNLLKHTEMNYIFNHKIKEQNPRVKNLNQFPIPKAENFLFGVSNDSRNQASTINTNRQRQRVSMKTDNGYKPTTNRTRVIDNSQSLGDITHSNPGNRKKQGNRSQLDYVGAVKRRQQAKKSIKARRDKLSYIYRTSW